MSPNHPSHLPGSHAGWENLFRSGMFPPRYQVFADPDAAVVDWADTLPPGGVVLDVGCGVGRHVRYLGSRGFKVAGTDLSPNGVQQTEAMCTEHGILFEGCVAEMTALPWPDATFDAALSTATICHHRRAGIMTALAEVHRVLKPGGLFLVDFLHKETQSYRHVREQTAAGLLTEVEPDTFVDLSDQPDPQDDAFMPHHYCDEADVRDLLRHFVILRVWEELPGKAADGGLAKRGYWIASVLRKPSTA